MIFPLTLGITVLGAVIIGLMLRIKRGTLQRQRKDIWWQINYDDVTILPWSKVRPHPAQTFTFLLTAADLWKRSHLGVGESGG